MLVSTKAMVISALKYGEADLIVKLYTLSDGLRTYMIRGVLKSKKGKFKTSMFQPLTKLEIVANHRNTGKLEYLKEARVAEPYRSLHTNPVKSAVVMFISEMLKNTIKEEEANPELFGFLEKSFEFLDHAERIASFHLLFLLKLSRYLGFYPENRNNEQPVFNLLDGVFQEIPTNDYCIEGSNVELLRLFLNTDFFSLQEIRLNQLRRNEFLNMLLLFYELHIENFRKPKSLAVLNEIF